MTFIENYTSRLISLLKAEFKQRLVYVGLQGSYMRGEETDSSDIDIMAVIDALTVKDLEIYKKLIEKAGDSDKSCGFICGREELLNWNRQEICHLVHTTKDLYGSLQEIAPQYSEADVKIYIRLSLDNLYHELCHSRVHSKGEERSNRLKGCFKSLFFILQNIYYVKTGRFYKTKNALAAALDKNDSAVFEAALRISNSDDLDYERDFALLFEWCQKHVQNFK